MSLEENVTKEWENVEQAERLCQAVQKCGRIVEGVDVTVILWWFSFSFLKLFYIILMS